MSPEEFAELRAMAEEAGQACYCSTATHCRQVECVCWCHLQGAA